MKDSLRGVKTITCKLCNKIIPRRGTYSKFCPECFLKQQKVNKYNHFLRNRRQYTDMGVKYRRERFEREPWRKTYAYIMYRCKYNKMSSYVKTGIKNYLTIENLKYLWKRDKAHKMKQPSIDRINPKKNYTLKNCRYIEKKYNTRTRLYL